MTNFTKAEKDRILLYKVAKGNPQAIIVAIDEVRRLSEKALNSTLESAEQKALTSLSERIERFLVAYEQNLRQAIATLEPLMEQKVKAIEPRKGEKGDKGDSPSRDELLALIEPLIPFVKDGEDGKTPDEDAIKKILEPLVASAVQNVQPTVQEQVEHEKKESDKLEALINKAVADKITKIKHPGGGVSGDRVVAGSGVIITSDVLGRKQISASGSFSVLTPTGDVDDSNIEFVFTQKPTLVNVNGAFYKEDSGWDWDDVDTVTLDFAPGVGGSVFGIV